MSLQKYITIYELLLKKIKSGVYKIKLPSENDLSTEFNVSRNTIRAAVKLLVEEGICVSAHGQGVFIIPFEQGKTFFISEVESFAKTMRRNKFEYETKVITFEEIIVDKEMMTRTRFPEGEVLYHIKRIRVVKGESIIFDENYFCKNLLPNMTKKIAASSIYAHIEKDAHLKLALTHRIIELDFPTKEHKESLDLKNYTMVANMHNFGYLHNGKQLEYTIATHRPDWFIFADVVKRK